MPYKHGRGFWGWVPRPNGGKKRVSLGTNEPTVAKAIEAVMRKLAGKRDWVLLGAVLDGRTTAGEVYDSELGGDERLAELRDRLSAVDLNQYVEPWQIWAGRRASASSVKRYAVQLRALIPAEKPFPSSHFTRRKISEALSKVPTSGSTANRYRAAWCSFGNYLVEIEILDNNPVKAVKAPRNNPPRELYLSLAEVRRLVDAQPEPYRSIAALREGAGVEIGAALTVRKRDIDEKNRSVYVRGTKNAWRSRPVFVEDWAWPYIEAASRGKLPDAPLFVCADGTPATYSGARVAHLAAMSALNFTNGYRIHDSRHSFAVRCMKAGMDPQVIASNLGHGDASMVLKVYGKHRVTDEDLQRARAGMGGL